jgi:hypothetical protein
MSLQFRAGHGRPRAGGCVAMGIDKVVDGH